MKKLLSLGLVLASVVVCSGCRNCGCGATAPSVVSSKPVPAEAVNLGPATTQTQAVVPVAHTEVAPGFAGSAKVENNLVRTACTT